MADVEFYMGTVGPFLIDDGDDLYNDPGQVALKKDITVKGDTVVSETSFNQSASAGTSTEVSRKDHTHGTPANPLSDGITQSVEVTTPSGAKTLNFTNGILTSVT